MKTFIFEILKNISTSSNYLIAIDGGTGAGKTTIVKKIKRIIEDEGYRVEVLHIDDFINKRSIRYNEDKEEWFCYYYLQWRYNYLVNEILKPIKQNIFLNKDIEIYDKEKDNYYLKQLSIRPGTIVLLEGVFLQRKELTGLFDLVIYIDVDKKERLRRVLERDTYIGNEFDIRSKYERRYLKAEAFYNNTYEPTKRANYIYKTGGK